MIFEDLPSEVRALIISFLRTVASAADIHRLYLAAKSVGELVSAPVQFCTHFNSNYGENVYLVGNTEDLGKWKILPQNKMEWSKGGWWRITKRIVEGALFEYKYVMVDSNGVMHWWEKENNHHLEIFTPPPMVAVSPSAKRRKKRRTNGSSSARGNPTSPRLTSPRLTSSSSISGPTEYRKHSAATKLHTEELDVLFNCRNRLLLSAEYDIKGYNFDLSQMFVLGPRHPARVRVMGATHGGHVLFSADDNALVRTTDLTTLQVTNDTPMERWILDVRVNRSDNLLYILTNWEVRLLDRRTYRVVQRIPGDFELRDTSFNSAFVVEGESNIYVGSRRRPDVFVPLAGSQKAIRHYDLRQSGTCVRSIESEVSIKHMAKYTEQPGDIFVTTWLEHDAQPNSVELFDTSKFTLDPIGDTNEVITSFKVGSGGQLLWGNHKGGVSVLWPHGDGYIWNKEKEHDGPVVGVDILDEDGSLFSASSTLGDSKIIKWVPHNPFY